jgi:hypothetical protein
MALSGRRHGYGRAVVILGLVARWRWRFSDGRLVTIAGQLRGVAAGIAAACDQCRRVS